MVNPQKRPFIITLSLLVLLACSPSSDTAAKERVRESAIAGSWYAGSPETLAKQVDDLLDRAPQPEVNAHRIRALIAPHAGYTWSGPCAAYCYKPLKGANVKRVVVLAPSHRAYFQGGSIADVDAYETPLGKVPLDREACDALLKCKSIQNRAEAHESEHSLEIQLPFLQRVLGDFKLIPIVLSEITPEQCLAIADLLRPMLNEETLLVMSSDFTHQGARFQYVPFKKDIKENIQRLDFMAVNHILNLDARGFWAFTDATKATICGRNPIKIGLTALPQQTQVEFLHYETSGDKSKDYSETVSYCAILFRERNEYLDEKETEAMLKTARATLEQTFKNNKATEYNIPEDQVTVRLKEQKGIFVTLQEKGQLRGCIGRLEGDQPLYKAAASTVLLSAFGDRRFQPLEKKELKDVDIEISIMSPMKPITSWKEIVLGRDGIVLEKKGRSALYLPQVALEQGWSVEQTLSHLSEKAGLSADDWKKGCEFKTFTAQVFGETFGVRGLASDK